MEMRVGRFVAAVVAAFLLAGGLGTVAPAYAQDQWYAEYFPNQGLAGAPVLTRYEEDTRFDWGLGSPGAGVPNNSFSLRLTRAQWFEAGTYRFSYRADDGVRVWVGSTLIIEDWRERQAYWSSLDLFIPRGTHVVRIEYFEAGGAAALEVGWARVVGGSGYRGEYFRNRDLSGSPALVRDDAAIDFDWGTGSPDAALPADNFSVRWTRSVGFLAGNYRFYASCDDGVRVYVDGAPVVDAWYDQKTSSTQWGDRYLAQGLHAITVEYYEHGGDAAAHVWWDRLGTFAGWEGRYYDNIDLRGGPAMIRDDAAIQFDWGEGPPTGWMPSDRFSVEWRRHVYFAPGYYRFNVQSDDGVRVWLGDRLLMDYWSPQAYQWHYVDGIYLAGTYPARVQYYEDAGFARIRFWYEPSGTTPSPATPTTPVLPGPEPGGPFHAEYFNNTTLSGPPDLVRTDPAIDFNWGSGQPAPGISRDHFSVRWTATVYFHDGRYRFQTLTDDGVRVHVDDRPVIVYWYPMRGTRTSYFTPGAGNHVVRVEYFERTQVARAHVTWSREGSVPQPVVPPAYRPPMCAVGPLRLEAWPTTTRCASGGWAATIYLKATGGDCVYTYAWEGVRKAGPLSGATTFDLWSPVLGAMVGRASVTSGGQTASVELYIPPPDSCD